MMPKDLKERLRAFNDHAVKYLIYPRKTLLEINSQVEGNRTFSM